MRHAVNAAGSEQRAHTKLKRHEGRCVDVGVEQHTFP